MLPSSLHAKDIEALFRVLTERGWNPLFIAGQNRHGNGKDSPLTDRQREVLHLIGNGLNRNEIATRLSIGVSTVASAATRSIKALPIIHAISCL